MAGKNTAVMGMCPEDYCAGRRGGYSCAEGKTLGQRQSSVAEAERKGMLGVEEKTAVSWYGCYDYNEEWYLIEMLLDCSPGEIRWDAIYVPQEGVSRENWQCPYLEQYLDPAGTGKVCETFDCPPRQEKPSRVVFFLYKVPAPLLHTQWGDFPLRCEGEVPERLKKVVEFEC